MVKAAARKTEAGIEEEHRCDRRRAFEARPDQEVRNSGEQRTCRGGQSPEEAVAGEGPRSAAAFDFVGKNGVLERHEYAGAARRGIDGSDEGNHQQQGEDMDRRIGKSCRDHQAGCCNQKPPAVMAASEETYANRQAGGAQQRHGRDDPDLERGHPEGQQVGR